MPFSNFPNLPNGDSGFFTSMMVVIMALWGGLVNYLTRIRKGAIEFSLLELAIEFIISGFAGLVIGMIALALNVSPLFSLALGGIAGHAGARTMYFVNKYFEKKFVSAINKIK